jgi:hypothetical protein
VCVRFRVQSGAGACSKRSCDAFVLHPINESFTVHRLPATAARLSAVRKVQAVRYSGCLPSGTWWFITQSMCLSETCMRTGAALPMSRNGALHACPE